MTLHRCNNQARFFHPLMSAMTPMDKPTRQGFNRPRAEPPQPQVRNRAPFVGNLTWTALQRTGSHLDYQERELIAADYAYVFLERNLRVGLAALEKDYTLQAGQREQADRVRQRAQAMLLQLAQEKNLLYQKVGSFRVVASHLEDLERQLRTRMPQQVMDMLGQQAAYQSP